MPIQFTCRCGRTLSVKNEYSGRHAKCPACGQTVQIPVLPPIHTLPTAALPLEAPEQRRFSFYEKLAIGIAGGGIVVLAVIIAILLFHKSDTRPPNAPQSPVATTPAEESPSAPTNTAVVAKVPASEAPVEEVPSAPESPLPQQGPKEESGPGSADQVPSAAGRRGPAWARIILDERLFPDSAFWDGVENAYRTRGPSAASEEGSSRVAVRLPSNAHLDSADLKSHYGRPELTTAGENIIWDCYGPLAFGRETGQTTYAHLRAPKQFFQQGFRAVATAATKPPSEPPPTPEPPAPPETSAPTAQDAASP